MRLTNETPLTANVRGVNLILRIKFVTILVRT